tara:strand:+ start:2377 stop:3843 length:1467 start_codon:yes stop_codon:yes gene_type:complete
MDKNNLLFFFNFNDETLSKIKKKLLLSSIFDNIYNASWQEYKSDVSDAVSISSLIKFDKFVINYIKNYKICNLKAYNEIMEKYLSTYTAMLLRRTKKEIAFNALEFRHLFNIHYKFIEKFLLSKNIKYIFMGPSSSAGFDLLFQLIPKYLNIKTIYAENFHSNRFFYTTIFSDWGFFKSVPELFDVAKVNVYSKDPTKLFYINQYANAIKKSNTFYDKFLFISKMIKLLFNTFVLSFFSKKILIESFFKTSIKLYVKATSSLYKINKQKNFNAKVKNLNFNYVYFPLSYQPEATTLAFGDEWDDQLLAIEKISNLIPENWKIVVKEHPFQIEGMYRGELFFKRLKLNHQVLLIDNSTYTSEELIINSKFVSTVSGNSGWESIRLLKPVLLFGRPWYLSCPGITHINNFVGLNSLFDKAWTIKDIENHIVSLSKKMGYGLLTLDYLKSKDIFNNFQLTEYNEDKNIESFVNSLCKIIKSKNIIWFNKSL